MARKSIANLPSEERCRDVESRMMIEEPDLQYSWYSMRWRGNSVNATYKFDMLLWQISLRGHTWYLVNDKSKFLFHHNCPYQHAFTWWKTIIVSSSLVGNPCRDAVTPQKVCSVLIAGICRVIIFSLNFKHQSLLFLYSNSSREFRWLIS